MRWKLRGNKLNQKNSTSVIKLFRLQDQHTIFTYLQNYKDVLKIFPDDMRITM